MSMNRGRGALPLTLTLSADICTDRRYSVMPRLSPNFSSVLARSALFCCRLSHCNAFPIINW